MKKGGNLDSNNLSEGCVSYILSFTSPPDTCRSALVSSIFRSAADSDLVWEKFLPSDYEEIISRSVFPVVFSSKKELYFRLCNNPILVDDGNKSFALDKWSGKKCYMIAARALHIIWADVPRYWRYRSHFASRFSEVVELLDVCWLDFWGLMETRMLSPSTTYVAYLVISFAENIHGFTAPVEISVKLAGGEETQTVAYLDPSLMSDVSPPPEGQHPRERGDGWMEIEMGEFFNDQGGDGLVEMRVRGVKDLRWKSGLIIQGMEVRPKRE